MKPQVACNIARKQATTLLNQNWTHFSHTTKFLKNAQK